MILRSVLAIAMLGAFGCSGQSSETADETAGMTGSEPQEEQMETLTVPAGYPLLVELENNLSTKENKAGDIFSAVLLEPIVIEGTEAVPAGSRVTGEITRLVAPGDDAEPVMTLEVTQVRSHEVDARPLTLKAEGSTGGDVEKIAAGGVAGGIIGGILGGTKGAAVGAGVGAGAGAVIAVATHNSQIELSSGQKIRFELARSLTLETNSLS